MDNANTESKPESENLKIDCTSLQKCTLCYWMSGHRGRSGGWDKRDPDTASSFIRSTVDDTTTFAFFGICSDYDGLSLVFGMLAYLDGWKEGIQVNVQDNSHLCLIVIIREISPFRWNRRWTTVIQSIGQGWFKRLEFPIERCNKEVLSGNLEQYASAEQYFRLRDSF